MVSIESLFSENIDFIQQVLNYDRNTITDRIIEELETELESYKTDKAEVYPEITDYFLICLIVEKEDIEEYEVKKIIKTVEEAIASEKEFLVGVV